MKRFLARAMVGLLRLYQRFVSPALPRRCKYEPTCSQYAVEAVRELGPFRGAAVAGWRLLRCNPLSGGGIDDVCDRRLFRDEGRDAEAARPGEAGAEEGSKASPRATSRGDGAPMEGEIAGVGT